MSEFIEDMQLRIISGLINMGVSEQVAGMVGSEIVRDIEAAWLGESVYIKRRDDRSKIHDEVRRRFNGRNAREIAREMGIGRATVYRAIKTPAR